MKVENIVQKDICNLLHATGESALHEIGMIRSMHQKKSSEMKEDPVSPNNEGSSSEKRTDKGNNVITNIMHLPEGKDEYTCLKLLTRGRR